MSEKIVQLNEEVIKGQIKELVRGSVEETLNGLLEAEAQKLTQAGRYERSAERQGYRSGHYSRNLTTTSGDVTLTTCRALRESRLRPPSSSGIAAEKAASKKRSLRCILPASQFAGWRTSPKPSGAARCLRPRSAS